MSESNYEVLLATEGKVMSFVVNPDPSSWERKKPSLLSRVFKSHLDYFYKKMSGLVFKLIVKEADNDYEQDVYKHYLIEVWEEGKDIPKLSFDYCGESSFEMFYCLLKNTHKYAFAWDKRKLAEKVCERIES